MICASCGRSVEASDAFCPGCGAAISSPVIGPTQRLTSLGSDHAARRDQKTRFIAATMRDGVCLKCGSEDIVPNYPIRDHSYGEIRELDVHTTEKPEALLFKGETWTSYLRAWICGQCGYTELYITEPEEFFNIYKRQKG